MYFFGQCQISYNSIGFFTTSATKQSKLTFYLFFEGHPVDVAWRDTVMRNAANYSNFGNMSIVRPRMHITGRLYFTFEICISLTRLQFETVTECCTALPRGGNVNTTSSSMDSHA